MKKSKSKREKRLLSSRIHIGILNSTIQIKDTEYHVKQACPNYSIKGTIKSAHCWSTDQCNWCASWEPAATRPFMEWFGCKAKVVQVKTKRQGSTGQKHCQDVTWLDSKCNLTLVTELLKPLSWLFNCCWNILNVYRLWRFRLTYLWFACVMVGLDEDLSQSDVFAHSHQSLLHRLPCSQDGNTCDLQKHTGGTQRFGNIHWDIQFNRIWGH